MRNAAPGVLPVRRRMCEDFVPLRQGPSVVCEVGTATIGLEELVPAVEVQHNVLLTLRSECRG